MHWARGSSCEFKVVSRWPLVQCNSQNLIGGYVRFTSPLGIMSWPEFEWDLKFVLHCPWCNVMAEFVLV